MRDGRCLSETRSELRTTLSSLRGQDVPGEAMTPPLFGTFSSPRGQDLFLVNDKVFCFDRRLYGPQHYLPGKPHYRGPVLLAQRGETIVRDVGGCAARVAVEGAVAEKPKVLWRSNRVAQICALALGADAVLAAGRSPSRGDQSPPQYALAATSIDDGALLWSHPLPGEPIWWGLALEKSGRIFVSLVDGRVVCLAAGRSG